MLNPNNEISQLKDAENFYNPKHNGKDIECNFKDKYFVFFFFYSFFCFFLNKK